MKLEDELRKVPNEFPEPNLNIDSLYSKTLEKENRHIPFRKSAILSFVFILIITLSFSIPYINYTKNKATSDLIELLGEAKEVSELEVPDTYNEFISKYNAFASKVSDVVIHDDYKDNKVVSPYSIFSCLAMIECISDNNTKKEILDAFDMTEELLNKNYPYFYYAHNYEIERYGGVTSLEKTDNSIWIKKDLKVKDTGVQSLSNNYFCNSFRIDFTNPLANKAITNYVSEKTNKLIDVNFEINPATISTLINILYLKDTWSQPIEESKEEYEFTNYDKTQTKKKFNMGEYIAGSLGEEREYCHFYTMTNKYKIKFILPNDGYDIHELFNEKNIAHVNNYKYDISAKKSTRCIFPDFNQESELLDIKDIIKTKLNIKDVFNENLADLFKLFYDRAVVTEVKHKSVLKVSKKGIEGAAVTMGVVSETAARIINNEKIDFIIDNAFGVIVTNRNDEIIFTGITDKI